MLFLMPSFMFNCFNTLGILWKIKGNFYLRDFFPLGNSIVPLNFELSWNSDVISCFPSILDVGM